MKIFYDIIKQAKSCTACELYKSRTNVVTGRGTFTPLVLFVGEAAGAEEDKQGLPFVGNSGKILEEWISFIDLTADEYSITNLVFCRPPNNRDPKPNEVKTCTDLYLNRMIDILNPRIIVPVGRIASAYFLGKNFLSGIINYSGSFYRDSNGRNIYPMLHPSFYLRNGSIKEQWEDKLLALKTHLEKL